MTARPGPWRIVAPYGICKGDRLVLEGDGSTTVDERQSIVDSLNRDYANEGSDHTIAEVYALIAQRDAALADVARLREALGNVVGAFCEVAGWWAGEGLRRHESANDHERVATAAQIRADVLNEARAAIAAVGGSIGRKDGLK